MNLIVECVVNTMFIHLVSNYSLSPKNIYLPNIYLDTLYLSVAQIYLQAMSFALTT